MDVIDLLLSANNGTSLIHEVVDHINAKIISSEKFVGKVAMDPFKLLTTVDEQITSECNLPSVGRFHYEHDMSDANVVNGKYIIKHQNNDTGHFVANLIARACSLNVPNNLLVRRNLVERNKGHRDQFHVQLIEYFIDWKDYSADIPRSISFLPDLAKILAFDLTVGNYNRFPLVFRYFRFIRVEKNKDINKENFFVSGPVKPNELGFSQGRLYAVSNTVNEHFLDIDELGPVHEMLKNPEHVDNMCNLMIHYFRIPEKNKDLFKAQFIYQYADNMSHFDKFSSLIKWAGRSLD